MGNTAAKEVESTELGKIVHHDGTDSINNTLVATKATKLIQKGNKLYYTSAHFEDYDKPCLTVESQGVFGKKGILRDCDERDIGKIAVSGFITEQTCIFREWPSFKGQIALTAQDLKKLNEPEDAKMHLFAKIETKMGFSTATATYSVVTGVDDKGEPVFQPLYIADKLSAMKFLAVVKTAGDDGVPVAKVAAQGGLSMANELEIAEGADMAAILVLIIAITPGSNVGALAGAGVI